MEGLIHPILHQGEGGADPLEGGTLKRVELPRSLILPFLFTLFPLLLEGCATAGIVEGRIMRVGSILSFSPPSGPSWHLVRNRRFFGNRLIYFRDEEAKGMITIEARKMERRAKRVPLRALSLFLFSSYGRRRGILTEVDSIHRISVDGREAFALSGRRRKGACWAVVTTVYIKLYEHLLVISLSSDEDHLDRVIDPFDALLSSIRIEDERGYDPDLIVEDGVEYDD